MKNLLLFACFVFMNCSVMHFDNGPVQGNYLTNSDWHHNYIFSLIEGSDPVLLNQRCQGKDWVRVTTKDTFVSGLVGSLEDWVIKSLTRTPENNLGVHFDIWNPQMVDCSCGK